MTGKREVSTRLRSGSPKPEPGEWTTPAFLETTQTLFGLTPLLALRPNATALPPESSNPSDFGPMRVSLN